MTHSREIQRHRAGDAVYANPRIPRPCDDPVAFLASQERYGAEVVSAVGHADTAAVFAAVLGRPVPVNRISVRLVGESLALVGQVVRPDGGPYRLPEGSTTLPDDAVIEWWTV